MLEGSPHPCGQLPLELAVTKGWDARVVDVVQKTYPKAAETLDPVKVPGGILKKAFPPPGKGLPDQEFLNELGGPEVLSNDIKGATVAVLALSGWNKDKQPTTPKGMRWVRKAAEECRPLPKLEVVMFCVEINQCVGCTDNSSLSHFSGIAWPSWLGRAARNRHRHAIEQASRRWRGG